MDKTASSLLLAIDTSTAQAGIALCTEEQVLAELNWHVGWRTTAQLVASVGQLWAMAVPDGRGVRTVGCSGTTDEKGLPAARDAGPLGLAAVVVATGPGSFSGLRAGMAAAKGFCLALNVPLITVPTLDVIAYPHLRSTAHVCAILEAGREQFYVGWYRSVAGRWRRLEEIALLGLEDISVKIGKRTVVCGELSPKHKQAIREKLGKLAVFPPAAFNVRRAAMLAQLGFERLAQGWNADLYTAEPFYVRRPAAKTLHDRVFPASGERLP